MITPEMSAPCALMSININANDIVLSAGENNGC
jgi:hypothetical protein